jgi:hypothetical protein
LLTEQDRRTTDGIGGKLCRAENGLIGKKNLLKAWYRKGEFL